jgi:hypothetical protein
VSTSRTKDWSIFSLVDRQALEVSERGVAGAEVVEREADPLLLEHVHGLDRILDVRQQEAFGQLELDALQVIARTAPTCSTWSTKVDDDATAVP